MISFNFKKWAFRYLPVLYLHKREIASKREWVTYHYMSMKYLKYKTDASIQTELVNPSVPIDRIVWMYWRQGEENAPRLVQKCIQSVRATFGEDRVIVLDEHSVGNYIRMPDFIDQKHKQGYIQEALYSDLLRISLLIQYGGIWCDATCYVTDALPDYVERTPLFMFQNTQLAGWSSPCVCSSWFIKADKEDPVLMALRNVLFHYCKRNNTLPHYYLFHITLALLLNTDERLRARWEEIPYVCNMNPHVMQFSFAKPYTVESYTHIQKSCFIHKLSYKYDKSLLETPVQNILQYFLS